MPGATTNTTLADALEACAAVGLEGCPDHEREVADAAASALEAVKPEPDLTFGVCVGGAMLVGADEFSDPVRALARARELKAIDPGEPVQILLWRAGE